MWLQKLYLITFERWCVRVCASVCMFNVHVHLWKYISYSGNQISALPSHQDVTQIHCVNTHVVVTCYFTHITSPFVRCAYVWCASSLVISHRSSEWINKVVELRSSMIYLGECVWHMCVWLWLCDVCQC